VYSTVAPLRQTDAPTGVQMALRFVKGIGPQRAGQLERKGLRTVEDALFFVPLRHEDRTQLTPLRALVPGQPATMTPEHVAGWPGTRARRGHRRRESAASRPLPGTVHRNA